MSTFIATCGKDPTRNTMKHLWEVNHPYYMTEGNYHSNNCTHVFETWQDFLEEWSDSDLDYNWFVRWDWLEARTPEEAEEYEEGTGVYNGDDNHRHATFLLQCVGQRKASLLSCRISVCRNDEAAILEFLRPRWEYMREMWRPFSDAE